jgi:hypothetical protein
MSVRDAIDLTIEEPGGSRGNPIDLSADNAENHIFEKRESTHRKITKMTTKRLEQAQDKGWVVAEDDSEFYVDEDTGECQALKPIYAANVGRHITNITWAAYQMTSNAGGSVTAKQWMYQELVRFCRERSCNFPAASGADRMNPRGVRRRKRSSHLSESGGTTSSFWSA